MKKFFQSTHFLCFFIIMGCLITLFESYKVNDQASYDRRILEVKQELRDGTSDANFDASGDNIKDICEKGIGVSLHGNELCGGKHGSADSLYLDDYSMKDFPSNDDTSGVICFRIAYEADVRGRFNHETYTRYCDAHCSFSDTLLCDIPAFGFTISGTGFLDEIYDDALKKNTAKYDLVHTDSYAYSSLVDFIGFLLPLIGLLIPINLNESGYKGVARFAILFVLLIFMFYFECDTISTCGMIFFAVTMAFVAPNSNLQQRSNMSVGALVAFAIISFKYDNVYLDIFMWVCVILSFGIMTYRSAMAKNGLEHSFIFINVAIFLMSMRCFYLLLVKRGSVGTFISLVNFSFSTVMPYGVYSSYWRNNLEASAALASKLASLGVNLSGRTMFLGLAGTGFVLSLLFRSLAGVAMVSSLHVKLPISAMFVGLYIYAIDVFGGFRVMFGMIFGTYKWSHRRGIYVVFNIITLFFEFYYGTEIFTIRCILFGLDITLINSGYLFVAKYLTTNVSFGGMAFPKAKSLPWFDSAGLSEIVNSVVKLTVNKSSGCVKGVGFIRADAHGNADLLTVRHVIQDHISPVSYSFCAESYNDNDVTNAVSRLMSDNGDPVVALSCKGQSHPNLQLLAKHEVRDVKALFCVHDEGAINFISEYSFQSDGEISAHINLRSGDSGSPVFSIMDDGTFRYVGAVSKGSFDTGSGNFISSVHIGYLAGSPGGDFRHVDVVAEHLERDRMYGNLHQILCESKEWLDAHFDDSATGNVKKKISKKRTHFKNRAMAMLDLINDDVLTERYLKLLDDREIVTFNTLRGTLSYNGRFVKARGS